MAKRNSRGSFFSRNNSFFFGNKRKNRTASAARTELGRRLEALEERRMLSVSVNIASVTTSGSEDGTDMLPALEVSGDLSGTTAADRTISLVNIGGSAGSSDYTMANVVLLAKDYGTKTVVDLTDPADLASGGITINNDILIEGDESFAFQYVESSTLFNLSVGGSAIPDTTLVNASHTIEDDDSATIDVTADQTVSEGGGGQTVEIKLNTIGNGVAGAGALTGDVSFSIDNTGGGTAIEDDGIKTVVDYDKFTKQSFTFSSGSTGGTQTVTLTPVSDRLVEGPETVEFALSDLSGPGSVGKDVSLGGDTDATIVDDDFASVSFDRASDSVVEPIVTTPVNVDVDLTLTTTGTTGPSELAGSLTVDIDITPDTTATNVTDFILSTTSFTFDDKTTSGTLTITVIGDTVVEGDELVDLDLVIDSSSPAGLKDQASLGTNPNFQLTIIDDESAVLNVASPTSVIEQTGTVPPIVPTVITYTISMTAPNALDVFVPVSLSGTAVAGQDYTDPGVSVVKITQGTTFTTLDVTVTPDFLVETDETLAMTIGSPSGNAGVVTPGTTVATTTITDDDESKVSIQPTTSAVDESVGTSDFVLVMSQPSSTDTTVTFSVDPASTATEGADFSVLTASPVTFKAGEQVKTVTVSIEDDSELEDDEDIILAVDSVISAGGLAVSKDPVLGKATKTILDNDDVTVSVGDLSIIEGTGGTTTAVLTVGMTGTVAGAFDVDFFTTDGTAISTGPMFDFVAKTGTVTLPSGTNTSTTISIDINPDADVEPNEDFTVSLKSPASNSLVTVDTTPATVTILNDDDAILSIVGTTVTEIDGAGLKAIVTLVRTGSTTLDFDAILDTVLIPGSAVDSGSAPGEPDFTAVVGGLVHFDAGETSDTLAIDITGDLVVEGPESFAVQIVDVFKTGTSTPETGVTITTDTTVVNIIDNDAAAVSVSRDADEVEGDTGDLLPMTRVVTFTMSKVAQEDVEVAFRTVDGTADSADYTQIPSDSVTIKAGDTTATAVITITRDDIVEDNETFDVEITGITKATGSVSVALPPGDKTTLTILDDDTATVDVLDLTPAVVEGSGGGTTKATVTIELTGDVQDAFDVDVEAFGLVPLDQTGAKGTLTFGPNAKSGDTLTFDTFIVADDITEPEESYTVDITGIKAKGSATVLEDGGAASGKVTIEDDDSASISVADISKAEGDAGTTAFDVVITLSGDVQESFKFDFDTSDGTAKVSDSDYKAKNTVGTFAANSKDGDTVTITVDAIGDTKVESDETVNITISELDPVPGTGTIGAVSIADATATMTIENDDATVASIIASKTPAAEGAAGNTDGEFTVSLSAESDTTILVTLANLPTGTATEGADYEAIGTSLVFLPGETSMKVGVVVINDLEDEPTETVILDIATVEGADASISATMNTATVEILDDEVSIADILVSGSAWTISPYSLLTGTLHDSSDPNSTLPWINLNTIEVVFTEDPPFDTPTVDTLALTGINVADYLPGATFSYSSGTMTATWVLSSLIGADRLDLTVNGEGTDPGSVPIDGGDFDEKFNVLPGDSVDDNFVSLIDVFDVFSKDGTGIPTPLSSPIRQDLDGDGVVSLVDVFAAFSYDGTSLPVPPPPPPMPAPLPARPSMRFLRDAGRPFDGYGDEEDEKDSHFSSIGKGREVLVRHDAVDAAFDRY